MANHEFCVVVNVAPAVGPVVWEEVGTGGRPVPPVPPVPPVLPVPVGRMPLELPEGTGDPEAVERIGKGTDVPEMVTAVPLSSGTVVSVNRGGETTVAVN